LTPRTTAPDQRPPTTSTSAFAKASRQGWHHVAALVRPAGRRVDVLFAMLRDGTFHEPPEIAEITTA
jgi:hypothetical protein